MPRDIIWDMCVDGKEEELAAYESRSKEAEAQLHAIAGEASAILNAYQKVENDQTITKLQSELEKEKPTYDSVVQAFMRTGQVMSRDAAAMGQGFRSAPHQELQARLAYAAYPYLTASDVARQLRSAARYLRRLLARPAAGRQAGTHIFIGHGHSQQWRILKDFLSERLGLLWNEFNSVPIAGMSNVQRLSDCLDQANFALLVLTAEDEMADNSFVARQNVIHEVGLFQGRLGFSRAIVLLEEGCNEFSNINGLGQLRFPKDNISAIFEDVRRVLEREGLLEG